MRIALTELGAGRPLVLIHGVGTDRTIWDLVQPRLSQRRRTIAIDVPGFGESEAAGEGFELERVAEAILDGVLEAGVEEPFDVLGQSLGGALALVLAAHQAGSIDRVILGAPAGFGGWPEHLAELVGLGTAAFMAGRQLVGDLASQSALARRLMYLGAVEDPALLAPQQARAMIRASARATRIREAMTTIMAADLRPELRAMRAPLGLVWGEHDGTVPIRNAELITGIRPDAELEVIPGVAHIPQVEAPGAYVDAVERLLDRLPANDLHRAPITDS